MLYINNKPTGILPLLAFAKKKDDDVDKRSNRETPGESEGARPPKKEEYKNSEGKKKKNSPEGRDQEVDNEEKDKNQKK